ncbi:N-acetylmuramic acid 6-phosphate etherase [Devosia sp. YIM 151766]|uniref:N-acetylmuramic acid 6-phosphate etherase n=1 Tax=Devosia sp. YIM 151766 TaxID=3017325 RepID=UPI00255C8633|nr:N-acetylmuramic acid 6-phosphate etherase [Devosia sp. YIM 151766]WIY53710.1 N-acetylmuramic acid 6-phosphate etherase [Devosia sp. YIM 151766]
MTHHLLSELDQLISEARNPAAEGLDGASALELVGLMNQEDRRVAEAVEEVLPEIAQAVELVSAAFRAGGRLIYTGAGTSGRLGVLDASECPPTFGVDEAMVVGIIAGGDLALRHAMEGAEDDEAAAIEDLKRHQLKAQDVVVGLAASGRTPYVLAGLRYARSLGAVTIGITCNPGSPITEAAQLAIVPVVGPEVLTGSTRLKSGTAQKMVLNMLTTASMVRIGKTFGNLMVDMRATNDKLKARALRIIGQATDASLQEAEAALARADNNVKVAIFMVLSGLDAPEARQRLAQANGILRTALDASGAQAASK